MICSTTNRNTVLEETGDAGEGKAPGNTALESNPSLTAKETRRTTEGAKRPFHPPSRPRVAPTGPGARERTCAEVLPPRRPTHLAGSRGNLKKARSDCVLFRVQLGAAQKFGMVVRPPAGPALPSPPRQGSAAAPRGRGGEPGRPAGSARPRAEEGLAREAARGRRGARAEAGLGPRLHSAVCGREDLPPPPPLLHLQPARDAAASFPQCTPALEGALSSLSPPPPALLSADLPGGLACALKSVWPAAVSQCTCAQPNPCKEGIAHAV